MPFAESALLSTVTACVHGICCAFLAVNTTVCYIWMTARMIIISNLGVRMRAFFLEKGGIRIIIVTMNAACLMCVCGLPLCTIALLQGCVQAESSSTGARIASRKVIAVVITSTIVRQTFIDICKSKILVGL